jgi:catechol 2,3-dioxygenase-like lactoylglutathione lyase family enzyme
MATILQNHYVLAVRDLNASANFFQLLGFAVVAQPEGWKFLRRDSCMVMLGLCTDAMPPRDLGDHNYFGYLRVDDVDAFHSEIASRSAVRASSVETKPWEMREFSVVSPEGHRMTIGQYVGTQP